MLIGDWNGECIGRSNSKQLRDEFDLVNIFHGKFPNHKKFKTCQEESMFIDYGLIHKELIDEVDQVTYEPFGYQKVKRITEGGILIYKRLPCLGIKSMECTSQREEAFRVKIVNYYQTTSE